ncbi:MAG: hypothetical protein F4190_05660 [Acidimicrobiales bacterium]|nr:hypothetical protein [Acidimicrobiales bacterium]MYG87999.1 hypothetical protein [Acidimicrobiales bacterium]MYI28372.1 hypothetical protein [Acidimicrobiales bacterium]
MSDSTDTDDVQPREVELMHPPDEHLYRQVVNAEFLDDNRPTYQAFMPHSESDELSVDRGAVLTAQAAYQNFLDNGGSSVGAWPVSVDDVHQAGLRAFDDSAKPGRHDGHAYISFNANPQETNNARKNWRKQRAGDLAHRASKHGPAYLPESSRSAGLVALPLPLDEPNSESL